MEKLLSYVEKSKLSIYFLLIAVYSVGFGYYITYYFKFNINIISYLSLNEVLVVSISGIIITLILIIIIFGIEYYLMKFILSKTSKKVVSKDYLIYCTGSTNAFATFIFTTLSLFFMRFVCLRVLSILFALTYAYYFTFSTRNRYLKKIYKESNVYKNKEIENEIKHPTELFNDYSESSKKINKRTLITNYITFIVMFFFLLFQTFSFAKYNYDYTIKNETKNNYAILMSNGHKFKTTANNSLKFIGETSKAFFFYDSRTKTTVTILKSNVMQCDKTKKQ